jgi:hypothetical protein
MGRRGTEQGIFARFAVIAAGVAIAGMLIAPTAAFAATKAATRIVVVSEKVVDWSTGASVAAPSVSVTLQKKSGSKWVALKGAVAMQMENAITKAWGAKTSKTGSALSFTLANRGRYRFVYAGTSTTKPVTAYTKRIDKIGESISGIVASRTEVDGTWTQVTVSYEVNWNAQAFPIYSTDRQLEFWFEGYFDNMSDTDPRFSGEVWFQQQMWEPGTVFISYRVRTADIPTDVTTQFYSDASFLSQDPYIKIDTTSEKEEYTVPTLLK